MGNGANQIFTEWNYHYPVGFQFRADLSGGFTAGTGIENDNIGIHGFGVNCKSRDHCCGLGKYFGIGVILSQAVYIMVECIESGRGQDTDLTHAAAEHLAGAMRPVDEIPRSADDRSHRRTQALRQAEGHRIHVRCQRLDIHVERRGRVEDPRTIHMHP